MAGGVAIARVERGDKSAREGQIRLFLSLDRDRQVRRSGTLSLLQNEEFLGGKCREEE
jgi:hypothetical protein